MYKCVHCGFCLQACPTYLETGLETESPRGRIALMKAVNEGRIGITPSVTRHWDLCIQCRACEVACPSGVPYGKLIESTMSQVNSRREKSWTTKIVSNIILKRIIPHRNRLLLIIKFLRLYQLTGIQKVLRNSGLLNLLSPYLSELEKSAPQVPATILETSGQTIRAIGVKRSRVALLSGCIMPLVNGPEMEAVIRVLTRNGCDVIVTQNQVCCGAINSHMGDLQTTRTLAKRNIDAFLNSDVDAVIVASAGCGIRMKEYGDLLRNDTAYASKAQTLSSLVKDIHEFLAELPIIPPKGHLNYQVTYQDSCHLSHAQRITEPPRMLLRSIPGIKLIEMDNPSKCCGAGGTYTITERDFSLRLLDSKIKDIDKTQASIVATANPGCVIQLQYGIKINCHNRTVKYVTDLLDESYSTESTV